MELLVALAGKAMLALFCGVCAGIGGYFGSRAAGRIHVRLNKLRGRE
jgi:phage shock protein PspC (stress-responsive transcriptional regulator)